MKRRPDAEFALRTTSRRQIADEWALVLVAEGLSPSVSRGAEGFVLEVPPDQVERAEHSLASYERENPVRQGAEAPVGSGALSAALAVSGALLLFFLVTGVRDPAVPWFERGSANAERILGGEFWRVVTALTLHADLPHVVSNALAGAFFLNAAGRALGAGLGGALVLLAGAGGNLVNALAHGGPHDSIGASTSVFGAVGILAGLAVVRRRRGGVRGRRAFVPIAAGLGLIAMLGVGARADLWAHAFGFVRGGALGAVAAVVAPRPPRARLQWLLAGAALVAVVACWRLALMG